MDGKPLTESLGTLAQILKAADLWDLIEKHYKPVNRPFRMCQPRDLLDQMVNIAKYNMEKPTLNPDLIDAGCATYFISQEKKEFGAKVRLD